MQARQASGHGSFDAYDEDDREGDSGTEEDAEILGQDIPVNPASGPSNAVVSDRVPGGDGSEIQPVANPPAPPKTEQAPVGPPSAAAVTPSSSSGPEGEGLHDRA